MSLFEIISIASILVTLAIALIGLQFIKQYKEFNKSKDKAEINSHRAHLESKVYFLQQSLTDDTYNFIDTNKLLVKFASDNSFENDIPNYTFFSSLGINLKEIVISFQDAFCLMPFHKQYDTLYKTIKKACEDMGIRCHRSDEHYEPGNLLRQIIQYIVSSRYVFAVLDGRNPNVFYEIGIAHSIGKPVFLIANYNQRGNLPFDIASSRLILYQNYKDLEKSIKKAIITNATYDTSGEE